MTTTHTQPEAPAAQTAQAPVRNRALAILSLVLGILSIVFAQAFLLPLTAVTVGALALQRNEPGRKMAIWGIVLGSVAVVGWLLIAGIGLAAFGPMLLFSLL